MMDTNATATLDIKFPEDDGAIARALSDLERKLTAWSGAIADAHAQLERATIETASSVQNAPAKRQKAPKTPLVSPPEPVAHVEPTAPVVIAPDARSAPTGAADASSKAKGALEGTRSIDSAVSDTVSLETDGPVVDGDDPMQMTAELPPPDDRELLESLDEETRQAVQLMRRLSPTKSLSELLELHRAASGATPDWKAKKKSWWKRGA